MSKYGVFSGPYFLAFGLNTGKNAVRMRENKDQKKLRIWTFSSNAGKYGPVKTQCKCKAPAFSGSS